VEPAAIQHGGFRLGDGDDAAAHDPRELFLALLGGEHFRVADAGGLEPLGDDHGGRHERGLRAGTENVPAIAGMGVAAARPDKTVVLFDGDGSLMMHVQELETIKRHRLNILIVVMNDAAYGSELHKLRAEGMPEDGSVFGHCDFAGVARGFGLEGRTFTKLDDVPKLVAEFAASGGAAVWDFRVSAKVVSPTIRRAHPHPAEKTEAER